MLKKFLLMSGVTEKQLHRQNKRLEHADDELLAKIEEMILDIRVHELRDVAEIWSLIPEAQWEQYILMEVEDLREQLLLKDSLKRLRNKYREILNYGRPKRKHRNQEDQGDSEGSSV